MITQWTCSQCQKDNPTSMKFCPHCGSPNPDASSASSPSRFAGYRKVWIAAIGLWLIGCVVLAVGGGVWWVRRQPAVETATQIASPTTISSEITPTPTAENLLPTPTQPEPAVILEATSEPIATDQDSHQSDSINTDGTTGDTLALPSAPKGIILFLSSRDHEPQTEEQRQNQSQHRDLELYAMRPDGSQQTRLSDGTRQFGSETVELTSYFIEGQVVINETSIFDLKTRQMVEELVATQLIDGRPVTFIHGNLGNPSSLVAANPVWSQAGEIVFYGGVAGSFSLYYLENISGAVQRLTVAPDKAWGDGFPAWSPDGQWIVFDRQWDDKKQDGLWIISKDGTESRRLVASDVSANGTRQSSWSPDGNVIAYEGPKKNAEHYFFELWTVDTEGQNPKQLTHLQNDLGIWSPVWSPDGKQVAFVIQDNKTLKEDIYIINAEGGEPQQLTSEGFYNIYPLWLPLDADEILTGGDTPLQSPPAPTPKPQPKPQSAVPANCPNPGVQILSPVEGSTFTERQVFIIGNANINRFHHWRLEYSTVKDGHTWNYLFERDYPANNDKLAMIDTSTVPNGPYGLRLTVVDETGNYPEPCEVWFTNGY